MTSAESVFSGSVSEIYDRHLSKVIFDPFARRLIQGLPECFSVLDIACGTGVCTRRISNVVHAGAAVVGLDRSESMVSLAARKLFASGSIGWVRGDAEQMPFEHDTFEVAVCNFGLMFFEDKARALEDIHRVLMPGGLFRYTVWASSTQNPWIEVYGPWFQTRFPISSLLGTTHRSVRRGRHKSGSHGRGWVSRSTISPRQVALTGVESCLSGTRFHSGNPGVRNLIVSRRVNVEQLEEKLAKEFVKQFGSPLRSTMRGFLFEAGVIE